MTLLVELANTYRDTILQLITSATHTAPDSEPANPGNEAPA